MLAFRFIRKNYPPLQSNLQEPEIGEPQRYYEIVYEELRNNIQRGLLQSGTVLYEAAVAKFFGVSRPPVKRALVMLEQANLIYRLNRRGFVVGTSEMNLRPTRANLHRLPLEIAYAIGNGALRASWQRIYDEVEQEVLSCSPFGSFQISETMLCEHYAVSRTVIRDVLSRMHGRRLIEKDRWSHWVAGPLSVRLLDEHFAMRRILEPAALFSACETLSKEYIAERLERLDSNATLALTKEALVGLEKDLHTDCVLNIRNRRLIEAINQNHLPFFINQQFAARIHPIGLDALRSEHRLVYNCLLLKAPDAAAAALEKHITASAVRTRSRLKVLSILKDVQVAPYLIRTS